MLVENLSGFDCVTIISAKFELVAIAVQLVHHS